MKTSRFLTLFVMIFIFLPGYSQNNRDDINGEWSDQEVTLYNTPEAEVMVRVGDIDNLSFGWPTNYDPFSGGSTPAHSYPFDPEPDDYEGTDRIMVITSYDGNPPSGQDGYTNGTSRPENLPRPIVLEYDLGGATVNSAALQIFVDDFQAPVWGANYFVTINEQQAPYIAQQINTLVQTGPIGKLINITIPPSQLSLVSSGSLNILFDDLTTGAGDGYAIDFVKLLVNPTNFTYTGTITGTVTESATGNPISGVNVSASGFVDGTTDMDGNYTLEGVPSGLINVTASALGYETHSGFVDLQDDQTVTYDIQLDEAFIPMCDTLNYPFEGTPTLYTVAPPESGYVCGNNTYGDLAKAEYFEPDEVGKFLYEGLFEFGYVSIASGQDPDIMFKVWDNQGNGGLPGNELASAAIPLSSIFDNVVNAEMTSITFDPPVEITGPFYLGLILPTVQGDTLALISSEADEFEINTAFELWFDETWFAFSNQNSWGANYTQAVYAVYCDQGFGISDPQDLPEVTVYPNPARDILNIEFSDRWANEEVTITIHNILGQELRSRIFNTGNERVSIDIGDLGSGIYLMNISTRDLRFTRKIIVE